MKKIYKLTEHIKPGELTKLLSSIIYYISILIFIIGFGFNDTPTPFGWYQQFMPNLNGQNIQDITFIDSLNGYAITGLHYILKTTTGGDNWSIIYNDTSNDIFKRIIFLNQNTGFVGGSIVINSQYYILKTTNSGTNWFYINAPFQSTYQDDMSILSEDTIWTAMSESLTGGVFYTSNGGVSWQHQLNIGSNNPNRIYMYNARIGFVSGSAQLRKTTNSGQTWTLLNGTGTGAFSDIFFIDSLTGWKAKDVGGGGWLMGKTTDGGFNWIEEILPSGGYISSGAGIEKFTNINSDTIWGAGIGAYIYYPTQRAFLYRTTNGGDSWYMQIPDTSFQIFNLSFVKFINKLNGWAYTTNGNGIHTITGGDTVFYTGIIKSGKNIPKNYILKQNYPNPFNPRTIIPYSIKSSGYVKLIAYDILGKEVQRLVDQKQEAGEYEVDFMGKFSASGVYFYRIEVTDDKSKQLFSETKTMVLIK